MSVTTSVIIHVGQADADRLPDFVEALAARTDPRHDLGNLAGPAARSANLWGGWKPPLLTLWAGAYNHLDEDALLSAISEFAWNAPDEVQAFISSSDLYDDSRLRLLYGEVPRWDTHRAADTVTYPGIELRVTIPAGVILQADSTRLHLMARIKNLRSCDWGDLIPLAGPADFRVEYRPVMLVNIPDDDPAEYSDPPPF